MEETYQAAIHFSYPAAFVLCGIVLGAVLPVGENGPLERSGLAREPLAGYRAVLFFLAFGVLMTLCLPSFAVRSLIAEARKGLAGIRSFGDGVRLGALLIGALAKLVSAVIPLMLLYSVVAWSLSWPLARTTFDAALLTGLLAFAIAILAAFMAGDSQLHKWFWGGLAAVVAIFVLGQCELRKGGSSWDDNTCAVPRYC